MTQIVEKAIINKIQKATYDALVESGEITPKMIKEEVWLFNDDQFVSASDKQNWDNKASEADIPTKVSQLENDAHYISEANIPTKTSELENDSGFITEADVPTKTSQLTNDSGFITSADIPTKTSQLTNDSGFITDADVPTKTSQLTNDSGYITSADVPTKVSDLTNDLGFIDNTVNDLTNYTLSTGVGSVIDLSINSSTYVMTLDLKNSSGTVLSTDSIDLPLESMVVNASYDSVNKAIILTLQSGSTITVPVGDLVAGLQTEITLQNKLASDLVDDTSQTNKFVTTAEKTAWNNKSDFSGSYSDLTSKPQINSVELIGNKSLDDLNVQVKGDYPDLALTNSDIDNLINNFAE